MGVVRTAGTIFIGIAASVAIVILIFSFIKLITPVFLILSGLFLLITIICVGFWLMRRFQ